MLARAIIKAARNPAIKKSHWLAENCCQFFKRSSPVAASIVGTARTKENSTMVFLFKPKTKPPTIVAAEREIPGIIASD